MALSLAFSTFVDFPGSPSTPGASDLNRLQDNDDFLARKPFASVVRNVDQAVGNGTEPTVAYNFDKADALGMHPDGGSAIISQVDGWYLVIANVAWELPATGTATGIRRVSIWKNDVMFNRVDQPANVGISTWQQCMALVDCPAGTVIQVHVAHSQGAPLTLAGGANVQMIWQRTL